MVAVATNLFKDITVDFLHLKKWNIVSNRSLTYAIYSDKNWSTILTCNHFLFIS